MQRDLTYKKLTRNQYITVRVWRRNRKEQNSVVHSQVYSRLQKRNVHEQTTTWQNSLKSAWSRHLGWFTDDALWDEKNKKLPAVTGRAEFKFKRCQKTFLFGSWDYGALWLRVNRRRIEIALLTYLLTYLLKTRDWKTWERIGYGKPRFSEHWRRWHSSDLRQRPTARATTFVSSGVRRHHFSGDAFVILSAIYGLRPAHRSLVSLMYALMLSRRLRKAVRINTTIN